jgi:transmembrane sensor
MDGGLVTMRDFEPSPRDARAEAAAWLARLHADDRSREDEEGFRAWLAENPAHAAAFEAVDHTWTIAAGSSREARPHFTRRHALMAGAGLVVLAGGSFSFLRSSSAHVYETDIGEQKHVSLQDGSQLFLDAQTRLSVAFSDTERAVDLQYGRANFRVTPDTRRPFIVEAARRKIIATQCNFDVHCEDGKVQVVLISGRADILPIASAFSLSRPSRSETLHGGDRLVSSDDDDRRDKPNLTPLLAWQSGSAIFENEALSEAIREMNRYSSEKLEVADDRVGRLRVSGVYRVGDNAAFARSIAKLLPIAVDRQGDRLVLTGADLDHG